MNIAITGHTSGIGAACYQLLSKEHSVIGLSRENGVDIACPAAVFAHCKDADVLINNAHSLTHQCTLLDYFFNAWGDLNNKTIISIGSYCTDYPRIEKTKDHEYWPYRDHKRMLEIRFRELSLTDHKCNLHLIKPGPVDTPMIRNLQCVKLPVEKVAQAIITILKYPEIKEMTIYA